MMMLHKSLAIFGYACLFMAITSTAQLPPVLDTDSQPLRRGVEYYIKPAITDVGGNLTLKSRSNAPCPLFVGQEPVTSTNIGLPVTFTPIVAGEDIIEESRSLNIVFEALSTCVTSTQWRVDEAESDTGRRFVGIGNDDGPSGIFRIDRNNGVYNIVWCPAMMGRPRCGSAGILVENGVRLLALDGDAFPFEFVKA
ncbi:kunitz type trypsin inhibitor 106-like [Benincasa hispida]|uniref:kunitz type trypsin inhibitor 106-like n=1 Tax=Benincasa hispida TaxID=102211 RepID=UPI00190008AC|nr:kunitz type trypsin inhibitor 106-like [Benincasa hispida]